MESREKRTERENEGRNPTQQGQVSSFHLHRILSISEARVRSGWVLSREMSRIYETVLSSALDCFDKRADRAMVLRSPSVLRWLLTWVSARVSTLDDEYR